ncbi:MAG: nickel-responsive transcriptional regulator NikR [Candidatus Aenigmatarchaeota archaeon]|nr:MAG: nickel-responsive transcriptional regulator NikR [Candidatus Aenigmarchaeota archaeon]
MGVERVGVSLEPDLLAKFDRLIKNQKYTSRSEAIRDLIRKALIESEIEKRRGNVIGTLTIVYDHTVSGVAKKLQNLQHAHLSEILSTLHIHIDKKRCLEVIIVSGSMQNVKKLADSIKAIKGVKQGELVVTKALF